MPPEPEKPAGRVPGLLKDQVSMSDDAGEIPEDVLKAFPGETE
jgi:hypothetical protein